MTSSETEDLERISAGSRWNAFPSAAVVTAILPSWPVPYLYPIRTFSGGMFLREGQACASRGVSGGGSRSQPPVNRKEASMTRRILIVAAILAAVVATGVAFDTAYGGSIPIKWKVSGTITNTFVYSVMAPTTPVPALMIQAVVKGAPGNGHFTITSVGNAPGYVPACGGVGQTFFSNDMAVILDDLSMIFARLDAGWACFNNDGTVSAEAHMIVTGGAGKYEGASGYFEGNFSGRPVGTSGFLSAETGIIEGEIDR